MPARDQSDLAADIARLFASAKTPPISAADARSIATNIIESMAFEAAISARLLPGAIGSNGEVLKIVSGAAAWAADAGGVSAADALAQIAPWARASNPSGTAPYARLPMSSAEIGRIPSGSPGNSKVWGTSSSGALGWYDQFALTTAQLDALGRVPDTIANADRGKVWAPSKTDNRADWRSVEDLIDSGVLTLDMLASEVTGRLVPALGSAGQVLKINQAGNGMVWGTDLAGSGGGLTEQQVLALFASWARAAPSGLGTAGQILAVNSAATAMAFIDAPRNRYRGAWSAGAFAVGDVTLHAGLHYICVTARTSSNTNGPAADTSGWRRYSVSASEISAWARIPSASPGANKVWKTNSSGTPGWRDEAAGTGGPPTAGALSFEHVENITLAATSSRTGGPMSALNDVLFLEFSYTRGNTTNLYFSSLLSKSDIGASSSAPLRFQLQGSGDAHVDIYQNSAGNIVFGGISNSGAYAGSGTSTVSIYNAVSGAKGDKGDPGAGVPTAGAADGKLLGHASGSPAWVDAPSGGDVDALEQAVDTAWLGVAKWRGDHSGSTAYAVGDIAEDLGTYHRCTVAHSSAFDSSGPTDSRESGNWTAVTGRERTAVDILLGRRRIPTAPPAGAAGQNKVWKTGPANEDPAWRDDASGSGGGSSTFAGLSDTPAALAGQGGKHVAVNSGATALEFVDAPSGGSPFVSVLLNADLAAVGNRRWDLGVDIPDSDDHLHIQIRFGQASSGNRVAFWARSKFLRRFTSRNGAHQTTTSLGSFGLWRQGSTLRLQGPAAAAGGGAIEIARYALGYAFSGTDLMYAGSAVPPDDEMVHFGSVPEGDGVSDIDFAVNDISTLHRLDLRDEDQNFAVSGLPDSGYRRLYWAVPEDWASERRFWLEGFGGIPMGDIVAPQDRIMSGTAYKIWMMDAANAVGAGFNGATVRVGEPR